MEAVGEHGTKLCEGSVQAKIQCVFESIVVEEPSTKRNYQPYKIVAIDKIRQSALASGIEVARATEKFDGTCVYIDCYRDVPWLWARHDRKPCKTAEKKFKRFQNDLRAWQAGGEVEGEKPVFIWNMDCDFKDTPVDWFVAGGVEVGEDGRPRPDDGGHIFGWVPIDPRGRSHMWHASTVDVEAGLALLLQMRPQTTDKLQLTLVPLVELVGSTLELIGTNINANPYKLGSKKQPLHLLVKHGSIPAEPAPLTHDAMTAWFSTPRGHVEGVVWYCHDKHMYKLHRHHLHQSWPLEGLPHVMSLPLLINIHEHDDLEPDSPLYKYTKLNQREFDSLKEFSDFFIAMVE